MRPVEIEILLKDKLSAMLAKSGDSVDAIIARIKGMGKEVWAALDEQQLKVGELRNQLSAMETALRGMKPGREQQELALNAAAARKVLDQETETLRRLEEQHRQTMEEVRKLGSAHDVLEQSAQRAGKQQESLGERIRTYRDSIKETEEALKELEAAYKNMAPGQAKLDRYNRIEETKTGLATDREILAELEAEQERLYGSSKRLSQEIRKLEDAMARMRLEGRDDTEQYREMARRAAELSDTVGDLHTQTRILASDTAGMDGLMSGMNGLAGVLSAATGAMGLLVGENENLAKVQARVQSVMAITMGLQQVSNALNKDSAFRLVTVAKAKQMLANANLRLATALGISNTAAKALMGTLTMGLSVAVGAAIHLWDTYSRKQEEAKEKEKERLEMELTGRAELVKTRIETEHAMKSLEQLNGSKEREALLVDELNTKWGDSMGQYNTAAKWYDTLKEKSDALAESLVLQAKVQAMVQKAVDADRKVQTLKETKEEDVDGAMGWFRRAMVRYAAGLTGTDSEKTIREHNRKVKEAAVASAEEEYQSYMDEIERLMKEQDTLKEKYGLGIKPKKTKATTADPTAADTKRQLAQEQRAAEELERLRWRNRQTEIDNLADGAEKRRRQIALDWERETGQLRKQEEAWKAAQDGELNQAQRDALKEGYLHATQERDRKLKELEQEETRREAKHLDTLLEQYKGYAQRRKEMEETYAADMAALGEALRRATAQGADTTALTEAMAARREAFRKETEELEHEVLQRTEFYDRLFSDTSEKGYKVLKDFYAQAKAVLDNAQTDGDGVLLSIPQEMEDGTAVSRTVRVTVAELERMKGKVDGIRKKLEKDNPFSALLTAWKGLTKSMREDGDVDGALETFHERFRKATETVRKWGDSLGDIFGNRVGKSIGEILDYMEGMETMGNGLAQIWTGDLVGGVTGVLGGLGKIVGMMKNWKEKMEEMKREWYLAEMETARSLRQRAEALAENRSQISGIIKDVEQLNWLVEHGYAKAGSVSVWESQSQALSTYMESLRTEMSANDELWNKLRKSDAYYEYGNSLNGGSERWSLGSTSAEEMELLYNQNKLSKEARAYYEAWVASGQEIEALRDKIEESHEAMREMVTGVSFDTFLGNARTALQAMRSDVDALGNFTEETLSEAVLNAFMYKDLARVMEPLYNELSDALIDGTADSDFLSAWRKKMDETMTAAGERLDAMADAAGVDLDRNTSQGSTSGSKASGFSAMTQDQGTKLEGMFTSGLQHWSHMDQTLERVSDDMNTAEGHLARISEHTGTSASRLGELLDEVRRMIRDGLKIK